ncbi:orotate phosphoribosyltransferase [Owenweeksia hongkongensis]|uniref:Orotate phosphoribosyltransferase n=1 Tax=Owenweeksia hongkongensis (strain DSM 17368 / CIP 108786 / JCM 12287 / NRRL B-23963 / UST20020801) TaxID=926562 RepID=G8QZC5_OWEHD|nr:orotate phosphoribosyltransferase [Owenweeksia hongkongensis]AEV32553.1 orotate phosphoribosyltransferase [Owenweeksia hongkongensis DSM 17368]
MIFDKEIARQTAEQLLQIKAIKLQPEDPFTWASGWKSPIYCDNRIILSYPMVRNYVREHLVKAIEEKYGTPDVIAGVATGAIAMGILVAQEMGLPFVYVRPEAKSHGRKNQIEGVIDSGQSVVVIEDLISTGGSSLKAVEALREENAKVIGMAAVFTYGFPVADENFKNANCDLLTLSDYNHLLEQVRDNGFLEDTTFATLQEWRKDPSAWKGV